jgi:hypothetical protein
VFDKARGLVSTFPFATPHDVLCIRTFTPHLHVPQASAFAGSVLM